MARLIDMASVQLGRGAMLRATASRVPFRRAEIAFPSREPVLIPLEEVSGAQLVGLTTEPNIHCEIGQDEVFLALPPIEPDDAEAYDRERQSFLDWQREQNDDHAAEGEGELDAHDQANAGEARLGGEQLSDTLAGVGGTGDQASERREGEDQSSGGAPVTPAPPPPPADPVTPAPPPPPPPVKTVKLKATKATT